jgi:hypothetical protein
MLLKDISSTTVNQTEQLLSYKMCETFVKYSSRDYRLMVQIRYFI